MDQGIFAPPRGFSQLIASFVASESQGIHRLPLLTFCSPHVSVRVDISQARSARFSTRLSTLDVQHVKDLFLVENNGFEPLTLCLQSRCSSQLS